ncbi:hypothetical protein CR513_07421, partial [Mucuna pruriens]
MRVFKALSRLSFEYLYKFYNLLILKDWKCHKFEEGLRYELKKVIIHMKIMEFVELVEKVKVVERFEPNSRSRPTRSKKYNGGGLLTSSLPIMSHIGSQETKPQIKPGHILRDCKVLPRLKSTSSVVRSTKSIVVRRMFAMSGTKASKFDNLILVECDIVANLLFDSSATHSFKSYVCMDRLALPTSSLPFDLIVSSPIATLVGYPFIVNGHCYKENLLFLPPSNLDVILGMDWLSSNQILIDYAKRTLIFPNLEDSGFITSN